MDYSDFFGPALAGKKNNREKAAIVSTLLATFEFHPLSMDVNHYLLNGWCFIGSGNHKRLPTRRIFND